MALTISTSISRRLQGRLGSAILHVNKNTNVSESCGGNKQMSSLTLRRLVVWAVSMVLGFGVAAAFVTLVLPWMGPNNGNPITIEKYGLQYFFWTGFPIGLIFLIWLDYLLDTRILPD
jgi:hypothetical protein